MSIRNTLVGVLVAASLAACQTVPQGPVALQKTTLAAPLRVGVAMTEPKVDLYLPGAGCLLCLAAATIANQSLNSYAHGLKDDDLLALKSEMVDLLRKKGLDASAVAGPLDIGSFDRLSQGPGTSPRNFSKFAANYDRLVVIDVQAVGFRRDYSAYIPTSDGKATLEANAYMVNLKTNSLDWYDTVKIVKSADGAWDEAPSFPGLTNAFYQAIETGKDQIKKPFIE
jgi:hypothetical protein